MEAETDAVKITMEATDAVMDSTPTSTRSRRSSIGPGKSPDFEDPYDARWQQQFEAAPIRPYKTKDEYLYAMREDLAEWLNDLYTIDITTENFFEKLETGSILCQHANNVRRAAIEYKQTLASKEDPVEDVDLNIGHAEIRYKPDAVEGTFIARDNICNFIHWCRHCLNIKEVLLFETDDLVLRKNTKSVILCLLEVARRGGKVGMAVPMLVQFEREIEMELRNSMNLSGMIAVPSEKSDSLSTGRTSPSSSAATSDIEPESSSSGAELEPLSDSSYRSSLGRYSPDPLPPISGSRESKHSKSKSLPRPTHLNHKTSTPLRRNNSLRRPRQLPCIPQPKPSGDNGPVKGVESWLHRRGRKTATGDRESPNRHSFPGYNVRGGMENEAAEEEEYEEYTGPQILLQPAILKSLDERVRDLVNRCTCPAQFPMIREAEGKYRIGANSTLIFVRILRNHVMVRVGGGWDTLEHYLDKHDPCRCEVHKKKKPHQRVNSQPGMPVPLRRSQSPIMRSQSPVQRTRRLSGGRYSWGKRSWDSFNDSVWERPATPDSSTTPTSTKSAAAALRRTDSMETETASMDSQMSANLTKTPELKSPLDATDNDLMSPASDLSAVERLIEEEGDQQTLKGNEDKESPMDEERSVSSRSSSPIPRVQKRPSRFSKTDKSATEHLLQQQRSSEANAAAISSTNGASNQTKSAPTSPKRNGAIFNVNVAGGRESPVESGDVWRRFAIAGAGGVRDTPSVSSPSVTRKGRSSSLKTSSRSSRDRSESPLLSSQSRSSTPSTRRKTRPHTPRMSEDRDSKKENVLMISRDSEGRHRLDSNSSCDSNDSRSIDDSSSGRRTPDRSKSKRSGLKVRDGTSGPHKRSLSGGKSATLERTRPRSTEPYTLTERQMQRPSSTGPYESSKGSRRRQTFHGDDPEHAHAIFKSLQNSAFKPPSRPSSAEPRESYGSPRPVRRPRRTTVHGENSEHKDAISKSLSDYSMKHRSHRSSGSGSKSSHASPATPRRHRWTTVHGDNAEHAKALTQSLEDRGVFRRKLSTPPDQFTKRTTKGQVWRRTPDIFDDQLRSSLEDRIESSGYPRSRSGNCSPVNRARPPSRSRLRPVTPVPRHMKVDSNVVTPMRKDEHITPTKIPLPVQHKKMLDDGRDVRTHSLPDLNLPKWIVRRIEQQSNEDYNVENFDRAQSFCSSMDSGSPTPSVKAENPNDSGYEDNSATKSSPMSTLSFTEDGSSPEATVELPAQQEVPEASGTTEDTSSLSFTEDGSPPEATVELPAQQEVPEASGTTEDTS